MAELLERPRHDEDFYAWAMDQAKRLRAAGRERSNEPIDWDELAEELEIVAKRDYSAAASYFTHILQHLLKVSYSGRSEPLRHWCHEIRQFREHLDRVTTRSIENRLRVQLPRYYALALEAAEIAQADEPQFADRSPLTCPYSFEQITGEWWPSRVEDIVANFDNRSAARPES